MNLNPISMGAAPLVAAALGRVLGIKVEMSHTAQTAMTDGKRIILPYLPVTLPEQIAKIVWGFIHHEAGHCRHTDFDVRMDNHKELAADKLLDRLLSILEDIRMERAHIRFYPGAARTLAELVEAVHPDGELVIDLPASLEQEGALHLEAAGDVVEAALLHADAAVAFEPDHVRL